MFSHRWKVCIIRFYQQSEYIQTPKTTK
jgi:hypothetical protein